WGLTSPFIAAPWYAAALVLTGHPFWPWFSASIFVSLIYALLVSAVVAGIRMSVSRKVAPYLRKEEIEEHRQGTSSWPPPPQ
ncbi:MAG TPA: hypothetical protein VFW40_03625, partial [Capsulimonadaceae bacterium]|nr:hypothetical protein [Capsulimonadaceae bacterium]